MPARPPRPPRVLMVCQQFGPDRPLTGGAERQAEKLALALLARGVAVELATPRDDPRWPARYEHDGLVVHTFPITDLSRVLPRGAGIPNALLRDRQTRRGLRALLPGFDLLHGHLGSALTAAAVPEARRARVPLLWKAASTGGTFDLRVLAATSALGRWLVRRAMRGVDRWVAVSGPVARELEDAGVPPGRIARIPNGVELGPPPVRAPAALARRFLYLGRLTRDRDFETLLRAFDHLAAAVPDVEVAMVGGGPHEDAVRALLGGLPHAAARTRLEGHATPGPWLEWADVLVLPSLMEGMSNALLEALAAGRACVASDIPPNREVLEGGAGILYPPGDPVALAANLRSLAETPGAAAAMGEAGRRRVAERYEIGRVAERYLELYAELLKS